MHPKPEFPHNRSIGAHAALYAFLIAITPPTIVAVLALALALRG